MDDKILAALIAGLVSLTVGLVSFLATRWKVEHELRQTQFRDILQKRIEIYPRLWSICIRYETNWVIDGKVKDRDWAQAFVAELNAFNIEGGLFFTEELYNSFGDVRAGLLRAVDETKPGEAVDPQLTAWIRIAIYGTTDDKGRVIPGLSTHLKDDLGSYHATALQRRLAQG